jgi:hypothetical protein
LDWNPVPSCFQSSSTTRAKKDQERGREVASFSVFAERGKRGEGEGGKGGREKGRRGEESQFQLQKKELWRIV